MNEVPGKINSLQKVSVSGLTYSYTIGKAEIKNALGYVIATLTEYKLSGDAGDTISLYRTEEGNWYEMKQADSPLKNAIMMGLKSAIDENEKNISM